MIGWLVANYLRCTVKIPGSNPQAGYP